MGGALSVAAHSVPLWIANSRQVGKRCLSRWFSCSCSKTGLLPPSGAHASCTLSSRMHCLLSDDATCPSGRLLRTPGLHRCRFLPTRAPRLTVEHAATGKRRDGSARTTFFITAAGLFARRSAQAAFSTTACRVLAARTATSKRRASANFMTPCLMSYFRSFVVAPKLRAYSTVFATRYFAKRSAAQVLVHRGEAVENKILA